MLCTAQEPELCKVKVSATVYKQPNSSRTKSKSATDIQPIPPKGYSLRYVVLEGNKELDRGVVQMKEDGEFEVSIHGGAYQSLIIRSTEFYTVRNRGHMNCNAKRPIHLVLKDHPLNLSDGVDESEAMVIARDSIGSGSWQVATDPDGKGEWKCTMIPRHTGRAMVARSTLHVFVDKKSGIITRTEREVGPNPMQNEGIPVRKGGSKKKPVK